MSDLGQIQFLKGSSRFKGAPERGIQINVPLEINSKEIDDYQRSVGVSLTDVFQRERQASTLFTPSCKFQVLFSNSYTGTATYDFNTVPYPPINNNLYYVDSYTTKLIQLNVVNPIQWPGYPQYNEFSFIRTDYNVAGYTYPPNEHLTLLPKDKTFTNWTYYFAQPYRNNQLRELYYEFSPSETINWIPLNGIPFKMNRVEANGKTLWQFTCPVKHNLNVGEFVQIPGLVLLDSSGAPVLKSSNIFEIYSLGNGKFNSEIKIFNILDVGYFQGPSSFIENKIGQFFRVLDKDNVVETKSQYYIKELKILTNYNNAILTNSGFEQNALRTTKKFESKDLTPNYFERVSVKEDSQSYNLSFNNTFNISNLLDNQNRPITELFFVVVNRGYFGYFNPPTSNGNGLKVGWDFNITQETNVWWERNNSFSDLNLNTLSYNKNGINFYYNDFLYSGDTIESDLCEWNNSTLVETTLSDCYHKFVFNPTSFNINTSIDNPLGYYYKPFYNIKIAQYSDYIENGNPLNTVDIPNYAFYSQYNNRFYWRDIYTYGFLDTDGNGVNYPFFNGKHYPYNNYIFRIIPEGTNTSLINIVKDPIIDGCE